MRILFWTLFALLCPVSGCTDVRVPDDFKQAISEVRYRSSRKALLNSMFNSDRSDNKPSSWVSFYFSDLGAVERPTTKEYFSDIDDAVLKTNRVRFVPSFPSSVYPVHSFPDPSLGRQLVIRGDDENGLIIVEAYESPSKPPLLVESWKFQPN